MPSRRQYARVEDLLLKEGLNGRRVARPSRMDIYSALRKDHRLFESLLNRLVRAKAGGDRWKTLLDELREGLIPHAHAEEAVFYNALREFDEGKRIVAESYVEHAVAETELRALLAMKKIDAKWNLGIKKLRNDLKHHIRQEEGHTFAMARKLFTKTEANEMGAAFERLKAEMQEDSGSIVASTRDLLANLRKKRKRAA